ncbi:hypothetical protein [Mucilaginibacter sp. FT3.2]|uniref:hypothetical protein n=1 Tax=Mucilaginibacter sp. FT3.2 TaxID=2723090 RepID=UPI0016141977|nr:hypothetical protein [Mucilaginibacter sp. FT3.2]MBB6234180.1 hypothetical protein [Mucilaginibacter sp. FT3.2]
MNNKRFGILLQVINILSIITLEKYWKNGIKVTFKKKEGKRMEGLSNDEPEIIDNKATHAIVY